MGSELRRSGVDVDQTRAAHQDLQNIEAKYLDMATDTALAAGGALPPPWGTAADVASLGRSLSRRDWGGALFDVVGFVPILGDGIKGGRVAVRLNHIRRSIDVARDAVQRNLRSTREAAERYWNNVARRNRQAYDDAIKNCQTKPCRDGKAAEGLAICEHAGRWTQWKLGRGAGRQRLETVERGACDRLPEWISGLFAPFAGQRRHSHAG